MSRLTITGRNPQNGRPLAVTVQDGLIREIEDGRKDEDVWLSPGFVDLQINGYCGDDVNREEPDPEAIVSLTGKMIALGVTTYLPTIITAAEARITAALRAIAEARRRSSLVANAVPFVHVEGPSISPTEGFRGAHPVEHIRPPSLAEFDRWQDASGGLVGMATLSPHFRGMEAYVSALTARGVHVALGHTDASADEIHRAVNAGARLSTHLGNGIASLIPRHSNVLWPQLAEDRLTATMIADGHHVPADMFKVMVRAKGFDRCILVSDTVALAGMPPGTYTTPVGGRVELHANDRLSLAGTEFLAGAALPLKDGVAPAMSMMGSSLADSLRMATENPGRFVGGLGVLRVGSPADLVRFTIEPGGTTLKIASVIVKGKEWQ
ncbi:MAG: amidohydrolase family protein [Acidobacteriaceae bacterium]